MLRKRTNFLREFRRRKGLSAYDLQLLSNIPAYVIYRIERGLAKPKHFERAFLAAAIGAPEEEIFPKNVQVELIIENKVDD